MGRSRKQTAGDGVIGIRSVRLRALWTLVAFGVGCAVGPTASGRSRVGSVGLGSVGSGVWFGLAGLAVMMGILVSGRGVFGRGRGWAFGVSVVLIGMGWSVFRLDEPSAWRLDQVVERSLGLETPGAYRDEQGVLVRVRGMVIEPMVAQRRGRELWEPTMWAGQRMRGQVRVDSVLMSDGQDDGLARWVRAGGVLSVVVVGGEEDGDELPRGVHAGRRVEIFGRWKPTGRRRNLGEPDWYRMGNQRGACGRIVVGDGSMIKEIGYGSVDQRLRGEMLAIKGGLGQRALSAIGLAGERGEERGVEGTEKGRLMSGALLLGERSGGSGDGMDEVYRTFQRVGVAHVLAISGFHLGLVVLMAMVLIRLCGAMPRVELVVMVVVLVVGMVLVPMRPPIVRAGVIVIAMLISGGVGRRYDRLTMLCWVGVGLLIWRPMDIGSLGYQLSMGITAVLVMYGMHRQRSAVDRRWRLRDRGRMGRLWLGMAEVVKVNAMCWLVALPIIVYHTGIVSVVAVGASVVLLPMVAVLMVVGYVQIALGMVWPTLAGQTLGVVDWMGGMIVDLAAWCDGLAYSSFRVGMVSGWLCGMSSVLIAGVLVGAVRWRDRRVWVVGGVLGLWWVGSLGGFGWMGSGAAKRVDMRVDMLDVGNGSCVVVHSGGEAMVWDCGSLDRRVGTMAGRAARRAGAGFGSGFGSGRISVAIVTHDNLDHFDGLVDLNEEIGIDRVLVSPTMIDGGSRAWRAMREALIGRGVEIGEIKRGDVFALGSATVRCVWPEPTMSVGMKANDQSVVVVIESGGEAGDVKSSVMLCGDIERGAMEQIEHLEGMMDVDVMEVPHHGSVHADGRGFVEWASPGVVLQSTGASRLGLAYWDSIAQRTRWYATADRGGVWVEIDRDGEVRDGWAVKGQ